VGEGFSDENSMAQMSAKFREMSEKVYVEAEKESNRVL
jgi:hypothetical protein